MNEGGLFKNLLLDKMHAYKGEKCHRDKRNIERFAILLGSNMDGFEKLALLITEKSKKQRWFLNVKLLPSDYQSNKIACVTITTFENHLKRLNAKMRRAKRSILTFIDNCAIHSKDTDNLSNIELYFLPTEHDFCFTTYRSGGN